MYRYKRNLKLVNSIVFILIVVVATVILINKRQDFSQPCRIVAINDNSITAEEWSSKYWEIGLMKVEIPATNSEAEVGDFVNLRAEFVDNNGNVLTSVPELNGNVYAVTSIDQAEGLWWVVQGPMTYQPGQGVASMPITNDSIKVGDLVNDAGQRVDMFGNLA